MTAAQTPQRMSSAISLTHCANCGATAYCALTPNTGEPIPQRRHDDRPLCSGCIETHLEARERREVQR